MKLSLVTLLLIFLVDSGVYTQSADSLTMNQILNTAVSFDPEAATDIIINSLSPSEKAMSDRYYEGGYWHMLWAMLVEVFIAVVFLFLGLSKWISKISKRPKNVNLQNLIYISFYIVFAFLLALPYKIYTDFIREHRFGLSNLSFGGWLWEELLSLLVTLILLSLLLLIIYFLIRKTRERWWIWAGGISTVFMAFTIFIYPVFIAPLFNEYTELPDGELKTEILSLARANGIPAEHVYQYDESKQTKRISANVSGIGSTIRISLNDNLLNRCKPEEIKAVMAHEMGHYVLHHVQQFILIFGVLFFFGFGLIHLTFQRLWRIWEKRWNISGISDIGGLPLLMVILSFCILLATPLTNTITRRSETEADIFGLNVAREADGFAHVAMMTSEYRKVDPDKWEEILFYDHPSPRTRVYTAMRWKAEHLDELDPDNTIP